MKVIKDTKKTSILLENNDIVEISSLLKKHIKITIKCLGDTLHLEENMEELECVNEEEKAIQAMKEYIKMQKKSK